jgi:DHA1 family tetracycline resistance protein-like MFS transporter
MKSKGLYIIFITVLIDMIGFGLIIPILPTFAKGDLGASDVMVGLLAASYSFMQFIFAPFWGGLSDRFGRRPIILTSIALMGLSYVVFAHSSTLAILFIARLMGGFGAANISVAYAYISDSTEPKNRTKAFGFIGAAFGLGFIIGPVFGGIIKETYNILTLGYAAAGLSVFNLIIAFIFLPESLKTFNKTKALFENPLKKLTYVFKNEFVGSLLFINFVYIAAFSMMTITAALLWKEQYNLSDKEVGYMFGFIGILIVIIQGGLIGPVNKRLGDFKMLILGVVLMMIGLVSMPFIPLEYFIPLELFALAFTAFGNSFLSTPAGSLISKNTSEQEQGMIMGTNQSMGSLGRIVGPLVGGALYGVNYYWPYVTSGVIMLFVVFLCIRLAKIHSSN